MYFIVFNETEERICLDFEEVANCLVQGWKLYGYAESKQQANFLLNECRNC